MGADHPSGESRTQERVQAVALVVADPGGPLLADVEGDHGGQGRLVDVIAAVRSARVQLPWCYAVA